MRQALTPDEFREHINRIENLQVVRRTNIYQKKGYDVAEIWATAMPSSTRGKVNNGKMKLTDVRADTLHTDAVLKIELKRK